MYEYKRGDTGYNFRFVSAATQEVKKLYLVSFFCFFGTYLGI